MAGVSFSKGEVVVQRAYQAGGRMRSRHRSCGAARPVRRLRVANRARRGSARARNETLASCDSCDDRNGTALSAERTRCLRRARPEASGSSSATLRNVAEHVAVLAEIALDRPRLTDDVPE